MNRFFVDNIGPDTACIEGEDLKHLSSVLRLRKGDKVMLSEKDKLSKCIKDAEYLFDYNEKLY